MQVPGSGAVKIVSPLKLAGCFLDRGLFPEDLSQYQQAAKCNLGYHTERRLHSNRPSIICRNYSSLNAVRAARHSTNGFSGLCSSRSKY